MFAFSHLSNAENKFREFPEYRFLAFSAPEPEKSSSLQNAIFEHFQPLSLKITPGSFQNAVFRHFQPLSPKITPESLQNAVFEHFQPLSLLIINIGAKPDVCDSQ